MPSVCDMRPIGRATLAGRERTICLLRYPDGSFAIVSGTDEDLVVYSVTLRPYVARRWEPNEVCLNVEDDRVTAADIAALVHADLIAPPHDTVHSGAMTFPVVRLRRTEAVPGLAPDVAPADAADSSW